MTDEEIVDKAVERVCGLEDVNIDSVRRSLHDLNVNQILEVAGMLRQKNEGLPGDDLVELIALVGKVRRERAT